MDLPEASKHGKKSTSQKLEDQKKVRTTFTLSTPSAEESSSLMPSAVSLCCLYKSNQLWLFTVLELLYLETEK